MGATPGSLGTVSTAAVADCSDARTITDEVKICSSSDGGTRHEGCESRWICGVGVGAARRADAVAEAVGSLGPQAATATAAASASARYRQARRRSMRGRYSIAVHQMLAVVRLGRPRALRVIVGKTAADLRNREGFSQHIHRL